MTVEQKIREAFDGIDFQIEQDPEGLVQIVMKIIGWHDCQKVRPDFHQPIYMRFEEDPQFHCEGYWDGIFWRHGDHTPTQRMPIEWMYAQGAAE